MSVVILVDVGLGKSGLDAFDDGGDPHATSDAECDQCVAAARAVEFVDSVSDQHGAGRAEWVAHGDGPTIDVELFVGNVELALCAEDDSGEGFERFESRPSYRQAAGRQESIGPPNSLDF